MLPQPLVIYCKTCAELQCKSVLVANYLKKVSAHVLTELCRDDMVTCPGIYRHFLQAVSTNYPTAAFLHPAYAAVP